MGVPSATFTDTYREKITDLMINLVEYVQCMDKLKNPESGPGLGAGTGTGTGDTIIPIKKSCLEKNRNGFPILPDPLPDDQTKKTAWDALFTDYLGQQYHLATGGKIMQIPYKLISENQREFIDSKYLPRNTIFRPPRNIILQEMKSIFEHLLQRQRIHGPEETFKFKSIKSKGNMVPSQYKPIYNYESDPNVADDNPLHNTSPGAGPGPGPGLRPLPIATVTPQNPNTSTPAARQPHIYPNTRAVSQLNTPPPSQPPSNRNTTEPEPGPASQLVVNGPNAINNRPRPRPITRKNKK
jgi:hypothetical protein